MYTVPPTKPNPPPSYARGLGFIAATLPLMMVAAWVYGGIKHTLVFYGFNMGLIPLCLGGWPLAVVYARRQRAQRSRTRVICGLVVAAPLGYMAVLISGDLLGRLLVRRMVFAVGRAVFQSSFRYNVGSWVTNWLEVAIAWVVVMLAVIYALRRWLPAPETDACIP
jgi:hypothetical protein